MMDPNVMEYEDPICVNDDCEFNDDLMEGHCSRGEEPAIHKCRDALIEGL